MRPEIAIAFWVLFTISLLLWATLAVTRKVTDWDPRTDNGDLTILALATSFTAVTLLFVAAACWWAYGFDLSVHFSTGKDNS